MEFDDDEHTVKVPHDLVLLTVNCRNLLYDSSFNACYFHGKLNMREIFYIFISTTHRF